ncbi:uncharacterized protein PGTG_11038 [Puccinia graminis f. sp. tritici CRL 75-36-700-3]|uniref:Uncharacterized protein n=1 Tax=Puccinia graminis f. sp. tritici (strain CRL 75-36-700-3 / race SCCL) TaxID=418459 RepID=E3KN73_PUCGT|nr:uncharacterized protein PGTG_11038 [Puccinia graminis f. sp. tritici CRL 75-36-700-3]EFP85709.1 hypothetical protein PGTG_11038 [Puccinia graminis f. sp. tritici CRL 75-36-700-3]
MDNKSKTYFCVRKTFSGGIRRFSLKSYYNRRSKAPIKQLENGIKADFSGYKQCVLVINNLRWDRQKWKGPDHFEKNQNHFCISNVVGLKEVAGDYLLLAKATSAIKGSKLGINHG